MGVGQIFTAWKDTPKADDFKTISKVKHRPWWNRVMGMYDEYDADATRSRGDIDSFTGQWEDAYRRFQPQEDKAVGRYFSGAMGKALELMRMRRKAAVEDAGARALDTVRRDNKLNLLGSGVGGSSYLTRMGLGAASDINIRNALDQSNAERGDLDYLERTKLGLLGQRLNARRNLLMPYQVRTSDLARRIGVLGNLGGQLDASTFTGITQKRDWMDKAGEFTDGLYSLYGSGGGGAPATSSMMPIGGGGDPSTYGNFYRGAGDKPYVSLPTGEPGGGVSWPAF